MNRLIVVKRLVSALLIALAVLIVVRQAVAVEPGLPSKTSILIASLRAFASHDPDPSIRNPDWLAERFIGPRERALIPGNFSVQALSLPYDEALKLGAVGAVSRAALIRTRFIDERLEKAIKDGKRQILILGAGFDSRAYRFRTELASSRVFEVDYGPTQEYKKQRVRDVLGGFPPNLVFAPIDFTKEKLDTVLRKAGFRERQPTFVIWEGTTFYISADAVRSTLKLLAALSAPGSSMAVDFMTKSYVEGDAKNPRKTPAGFPQWGEPWVFGVNDGEERQFFSEGGFDIVKEVSLSGSDPEVTKQWLTRKDGTIYAGVNAGASFTAPTGKPGYWIAEMNVARGQK